jgi:hypothetical protein
VDTLDVKSVVVLTQYLEISESAVSVLEKWQTRD